MATRKFEITYVAYTIFMLDSTALKCLLRCEEKLPDSEGDWGNLEREI